MKNIRRTIAFLLALIMMIQPAVTAFADTDISLSGVKSREESVQETTTASEAGKSGKKAALGEDLSGWEETGDGRLRYKDEYGEYVSSAWAPRNDGYSWLDEDGYMATDRVIPDGEDIYYVDEDGYRVAGRWVQITVEDEDEWMYFAPSTGKAYTDGPFEINGKVYLFNADGYLCSGFCAWDGTPEENPLYADCYFLPGIESGGGYSGWFDAKAYDEDDLYPDMDEVKLYFKEGTKYVSRTSTITGVRYTFDEHGAVTSAVKVFIYFGNGGLTEDGDEEVTVTPGAGEEILTLAENMFINGTKEFLGWAVDNPDGVRVLYQPGEEISVERNSAISAVWPTGTAPKWDIVRNGDEEDWYYMRNNVAVRNEWQMSGGKWFRLGDDGKMIRDGYFCADGDYYRTDASGARVNSRWSVVVDEEGTAHSVYLGTDGKAYAGTSVQIGGASCSFDETGYLQADHIVTLEEQEGSTCRIKELEIGEGNKGQMTLPVPEKGAVPFAYWSADEDGEEEFTDADLALLTDDITLYQNWQDGEYAFYTVIHDRETLNGTTDQIRERKKGKAGEQTAAEAKTYNGFTAGSFTQQAILADGTTEVVIPYTRNSYTITFNMNGNGEQIAPVSAIYGAALTAPPDPAAEGYVFQGWFRSNLPFTFRTMPSYDITLDARWLTGAGWEQDDIGWKYKKDGQYVTDAFNIKIGDYYYCFDSNGYMITGRFVTHNGATVYCQEDGRLPHNVWYRIFDQESGETRWYFFNTNRLMVFDTVLAWNNRKYSFDEKGRMNYGPLNEDYEMLTGTDGVLACTYLAGNSEDGSIRTGFVNVGLTGIYEEYQDLTSTWLYFYPAGTGSDYGKKLTGTQEIGGVGYEFDENGVLISGNTVRLDSNNGTEQSKSLTVPTGRSFAIPDCPYETAGAVFTGWNSEHGGTGTVYQPGVQITPAAALNLYAQWQYEQGWHEIGGEWYCYDSSGKRMKRCWIKTSHIFDTESGTTEYWYYLGSDGRRQTEGVKLINGKYYLFNQYRHMSGGFAVGEMEDPTDPRSLTVDRAKTQELNTRIYERVKSSVISGFDPGEDNVILFFSYDIETDGSMKTGTVNITLKGQSFSMSFESNGCAYEGVYQKKIYHNGILQTAGGALFGLKRLYKGTAGLQEGYYLVNNDGTILSNTYGQDADEIYWAVKDYRQNFRIIDKEYAEYAAQTILSEDMNDILEGEASFAAEGMAFDLYVREELSQYEEDGYYFIDYRMSEKIVHTWKNYDGTVLETKVAEAGETPEYTGKVPARAATAQYTYTFNGWEKEAGSYEIVYTAKFRKTAVRYTVTYVLDGGKNSASNPASYNADTATITLKDPTKTGYTFKGWYKESAFKTKVTSIAKGSTGNIKLYAKWEKTKYTISYVLDGGKNSASNPTFYYVDTKTITLKSPTKTNYVFRGWYSDSKFKKQVKTIAKGSTGNVKLYAKWEKVSYTITYVLDGGKNSSSNPASYPFDAKGITLKNPTRTGYTFKGWYSDSKFKKQVKTIAKGSTGSKKLYAKWEANKYTVVFNANGGKGSMSKLSSRVYGKSFKLPANKFTRSGYTFAGWNTKKDGKGTAYKNAASVKNLSTKSGGTVTLYAQWKKKK